MTFKYLLKLKPMNSMKSYYRMCTLITQTSKKFKIQLDGTIIIYKDIILKCLTFKISWIKFQVVSSHGMVIIDSAKREF